MFREKLEELGLELPLLPATSVGSFPPPPGSDGVPGGESFGTAAWEATGFWIRKQEEIGLDVLVDGEQGRPDPVALFAGRMRGFRRGGPVRRYGNVYHARPVIVAEVRWREPVVAGWWKRAQELTSRPVKGVVPGPYTMMDSSFNEHYPSRRAATLALAREIRKEVEALVEAGCRIVQLDEPALGVRPDELGVAVDAVETVTGKLPAYFVLHTCYGTLADIHPGVLQMPVHNFDLEMTNGSFASLETVARADFGKDLSLGAFDVQSRKADSSETIERRIRRVLKVLEPEQVWVSPDCGLKGRTAEEAAAQLTAMRSAVGSARKDL